MFELCNDFRNISLVRPENYVLFVFCLVFNVSFLNNYNYLGRSTDLEVAQLQVVVRLPYVEVMNDVALKRAVILGTKCVPFAQDEAERAVQCALKIPVLLTHVIGQQWHLTGLAATVSPTPVEEKGVSL